MKFAYNKLLEKCSSNEAYRLYTYLPTPYFFELKNFNDDTKNIIELRTLLNNSDIPFLMDINEFDKLPETFQKEILKKYVRIF